ncbi:MAG: hypothetical protein ACXWV4_09625 [Flavitalea sp.]
MVFPHASLTSPFETIFRWGKRWTSIHVDPVIDTECTSFRVTLYDGSAVLLKKEPGSGWVESEGFTERSKILGSAIDEFYKIAI